MDARSLIGSAPRAPLRATLREALRFVGANLPVRCRLRSISLRCYVMARSAVLSADTRRLRAAPLARSLPLPICRLRASPCRAEGAKGAPPPYQVCCPLAVLLKQNRMRSPSLPEAARARLRPSVGLLSRNAIGGAVPANPGVRSGRRQGHRLVWPNRKIKTLAAGRKTPAPQPDFRQPSVTVSWPKRPLTGQAATTTVPSRQWPQIRACDTGIVAIVVDP